MGFFGGFGVCGNFFKVLIFAPIRSSVSLDIWSTPPGPSGLGVKKELCVGRPCEGKIPTSNMALKLIF